MAYTNAITRASALPFSSFSSLFQFFLARAESFATEAEKEKKLHLLNSVSDKTLSRMGLCREDLRAHVLGH